MTALGINRIRLEFKDKERITYTALGGSINRIRLEFKVVSKRHLFNCWYWY